MIARRRVISGQAAALAARGPSAQPAELPIKQPARFELIVNAGTAKTLDLGWLRSVVVREPEIVQ